MVAYEADMLPCTAALDLTALCLTSSPFPSSSLNPFTHSQAAAAAGGSTV
jgi:hypothetical protein